MAVKTYLQEKADCIRDSVIEVSLRNGAGHIASSLSCVDILTALFYDVMAYDADDPPSEGRDRLILSKAHGCYSLYAILADKGVIPRREWEHYHTPQSTLPGCAERRPEYGIEAGCGSLGHGLPIAAGLAFAAALQGAPFHVFCVAGDGELQEGTTWEALSFAVKHELNRLVLIVDNNRLQAMDFRVRILDKREHDLLNRLRGFGLNPEVRPGHDASGLACILKKFKHSGKPGPKVLIADTVKGYGLKCMENVPKFHFRVPCKKELQEGRTY